MDRKFWTFDLLLKVVLVDVIPVNFFILLNL